MGEKAMAMMARDAMHERMEGISTVEKKRWEVEGGEGGEASLSDGEERGETSVVDDGRRRRRKL